MSGDGGAQRRARRSAREEEPTLELIAKLRIGQLGGKSLRPSDRQRVVGYLTAEGASVPEIAKLLGQSERNVQRDRAAVREANVLVADERFASVFLGELLSEMRAGLARLRRAANDPQAAPRDRIEAERVAGELRASAAQLLLQVGLLPSAPRPPAGVMHLVATAAPPEDPQEELRLLRTMAPALLTAAERSASSEATVPGGDAA